MPPLKTSESRLTPIAAAIVAVALSISAARAQDSIAPSSAPQTVTVTGSADDGSGQVLKRKVDAGALGSKSQLETPFSTTAVSAADMQALQINKLADYFSSDASVTDNGAAYGAWASYLSVRGLPLDWQNSYRIDGNPFLAYVTVLPSEHFEQVELFKGATGFMNGFGSPGGMLNYVTKRPTDEPVHSFSLGYSDKSLWSEHADLGGRVGSGGLFGYRLNATHEAGGTYNDGTLHRDSLSLALDARLTNTLTWDGQALLQKRNVSGPEPTIYTGLLSGSLPAATRNDDDHLVHDGVFANNRFGYYATGLTYAFAPDWTARMSYSHSSTSTHRNESILYLLDAAGNYSDYYSDYAESYRFDHVQATAQGRLVTAGLRHELVLGASWQKQENSYSSNGVYALAGTGSIFASNTNGYRSQGGLDIYRAADIWQKAVFASDTLALSDRWSVLGGLRGIDYDQAGYDTDGAQSSRYKKSVLTPTVAVTYKWAPQTLAYASYVESMEQGSTVGTTYANRGDLLDPLKSRQYEVGVKTTRDDWSATAALFRIERGASYANAGNELVQDGLSVYQGLELGGSARVARDWNVGGSLMLLDAKYGRGSAYDGNRVAGAPRSTVTARLAYRPPQLRGLSLHADAKYTGATGLRPADDIQVPGYVLFNVGASYDTRIGSHDTSWRLNVNNATDRRYWMFQYADYVKAGDPRTISASTTLSF